MCHCVLPAERPLPRVRANTPQAHMAQARRWLPFSVKKQIANIFGFVDSSVAPTPYRKWAVSAHDLRILSFTFSHL